TSFDGLNSCAKGYALIERDLAGAPPPDDAGHGGSEIAAERHLGADDLAPFALAPTLPGSVEIIDEGPKTGTDRAAFAHEGSDRRGQVLQLADGVLDAGRLHEVASFMKALPAIQRPQQDPGKLTHELLRKGDILHAVEAPGQTHDKEATSQRRAGI